MIIVSVGCDQDSYGFECSMLNTREWAQKSGSLVLLIEEFESQHHQPWNVYEVMTKKKSELQRLIQTKGIWSGDWHQLKILKHGMILHNK